MLTQYSPLRPTLPTQFTNSLNSEIKHAVAESGASGNLFDLAEFDRIFSDPATKEKEDVHTVALQAIAPRVDRPQISPQGGPVVVGAAEQAHTQRVSQADKKQFGN